MTVVLPPMPVNITIAVILMAIAYASVIMKIQRKVSNPKRMREVQAKIKSISKEMSEMMKRNEDIRAKQAEMMPLMKESMGTQMKSMFIALPLFFAVYYGLLPVLFGQFSIEVVNFVVPLGYGTLFIATVFIFGFVIGGAFMIRDRAKAKKTAPKTVDVDFDRA